MNEVTMIITNRTEFLKHLRSRFPLIHNSNVFFRDLHYGVMSFLLDHGRKTAYGKAERIAREVAEELEKLGILKKIDPRAWVLVYPEFTLARTDGKKAA
jgi:hypothetical protein